MMKRILFLVCLVLVLGLSAAGAEEVTLDVVALPGTTGLTLVKVFADRPDLGTGVTARYEVVKSPDQAVARIVSGEAEIAAIPTNTAAILYNKDIPIKLAAVTNWGIMYVVSREQVSAWTDLRGREIVMNGRGATPDILLRYLLAANGLDPETDVHIRYLASPVELTQLAATGKIDTAVMPEPWATEAVSRNRDLRVVLDFQTEWKRVEKRNESYPTSCLVVQADFARRHPEILAAFLRAAAASSAWVNDKPAQAGELAQQYVGINAQAARDAIPRCNLRFVPAAQARTEVDYYLNRLLQFESQSVGGGLPDANFYAE